MRVVQINSAALCVAVFLFAGGSVAIASPAAEGVIRGLIDSLVQVAAIEPEPELAERIELLEPVVAGAHDYTSMGRRTVRRHWNGFSEEEQAQFIEAFGRLSVATYASRFSAVEPGSLEISGTDSLDDQNAVVRVLVHRVDDEDIELSYRMRQAEDQWQIVDVLADGASEVAMLNTQNSGLVESGGITALLEDIERQIAEL